MNELGFEIQKALEWFQSENNAPFVRVRVGEEVAQSWVELMALPVRRCYLTDDLISSRVGVDDITVSEIIGATLPSAGSTMSGDFGEILVYVYNSVQQLPAICIGPKKWRLKQDRTKPAPYSDVLTFALSSWPEATTEDALLCSEVKTKATAGAFSPIEDAIRDCETDRNSRLLKTLIWLEERAIKEDLGAVKLAHIRRFLHTTDYPPAQRVFSAVAVICESLVEAEIANAPNETPEDYTLVVISVPRLKEIYTAMYDAVHATANTLEESTR